MRTEKVGFGASKRVKYFTQFNDFVTKITITKNADPELVKAFNKQDIKADVIFK